MKTKPKLPASQRAESAKKKLKLKVPCPLMITPLRFRTLAAASGWNECSLITTYRQGLEPRLRLQLALYDDSHGLEKLMQLSIRCENRMQSCYEDQSPLSITPIHRSEITRTPEAGSEPMQVNTNRLSSVDRQRRLTWGLCLYCGIGGHVIALCPIHPPSPMVSAIEPTT